MTAAVPDPRFRDQLAEALRKAAHVCGWDVPCPCVDWPDEQYDATVHATTVSAGHVNEVQGIPEAFADALLSGPLAPLLADQATWRELLRQVVMDWVPECNVPDCTCSAHRARRALDGPR